MKQWLENYLNSLDGQRILERTEAEEHEFINYPVPGVRYNAYNILESEVKVILSHPYPDARSTLYSNGHAWSNSMGYDSDVGRKLINQIEGEYKGEVKVKNDHDFSRWTKQGVFLPHQYLTTRWNTNKPNQDIRWDKMFWACMEYLIQQSQPRAFILVCHDRQRRNVNKLRRINAKMHQHLLLASNTRGQFINRTSYFQSANLFLRNHGIKEIDWEK